MKKEEKISFLKRMIISIKDFEKYQDFALENVKVGIKYLLKLMLIFIAVISVTLSYKSSITINNGIEYFKTSIPDLKFENNTLKLDSESPIVIENSEFPGIIIIDTEDLKEEKINEYSKKISLYDNGILFLKDRVVIKNISTTIQNTKMYDELAKKYNIDSFSKQDIVNYVEGYNMYAVYIAIFIMVFIYLYILYFISVLIDALLLAVLGYFTSRILRVKIKYSAVFNMSIYALTLPIILNALYIVINVLTGFTIKYFDIMYTAISYIYIITAILMIRADLIKRQIELMNLINKQEEVRQEIEGEKNKEDEDKNSVDNDKKDNDDKEKEKGKSDEDNNIGKEVQGEV